MSADCESVVSPSIGPDTLPHPLAMPSNSLRSERHPHSSISYEGRVSLISPMNSYEATMRAAFSPTSLSSSNLHSPPFSTTPNHLNHPNSLHFPFPEDSRRSVMPIPPQSHSTPGSSRGNYGSPYNQFHNDALYGSNVSIKQENMESSPPTFENEHGIISENNSNDNGEPYDNSPFHKFQHYPEMAKSSFSSGTEMNHDISPNEKHDVSHGENASEVGSPFNSQDNEERAMSPDSDHNFPRDPDTDPTSLMNTYLDTTQENIHHGENSKSLKCNYCSYSTDSRTEFAAHLSTHFDHKCMKCEFTTHTVEELKVHLKEEHDLSPDDVDDFENSRVPRINSQGKVKTFKCKQCGYIAITKGLFWEHAKTHIKSDKILACSKCPFVTEYKHHLEYHMRNHFGSKPYKCNKCSYSCVNKSMLNSHMKSHSNIYQYRCSDCTYATKYCHSLKLHLRKYGHTPAMVLNPDGTPNPVPIIDIYGTRRGPKLKKDENGMPILPPQYQLQAQFVRAQMEVTGTIPPAPTVPAEKYSNKGNNIPPINLPIPPAPFSNPFHFSGNTQNYPSFIPNEFMETGEQTNPRDENKDNPNDSGDKEEKLNVSKSPEVQESFKCDICNFSAQSKDILSHHMMLHTKEKEELEKREKQTLKNSKESPNHEMQKDQHASASSQVVEDQPKVPQQPFVPHLSAAQNSLQEYFARAMNPLLYPPLMSGPNFVHPALELQQQLQRLVYQSSKEQRHQKLESSLSLSPIKLTQEQTETVLDLSKEQTPPSGVSTSQQPSSTSPSCLPASPPNSDVSTPPSKSRRKGRAFKLERIALRLSGSEEGENSCSENSDTPKEQEGKKLTENEIPQLLPMELPESKKSEPLNFNGKWKEAHQCQYCDIAFKDIVMYTMHMGYHGYKNPFTCNMCGYDAADKVAFFLHIGRSSHL